jgi:hypothetical protein
MTIPMVAHLLGGGPVWPLWVTGTLLFGGAVASMAVPLRLRHACFGVSGVGLVATIVVYLLLPAAPPAPPGLSLRIAAPPDGATVTSPVVVRVCAGANSVPGAGRLLSISVDGHQVAEVNVGTAAINVARGEHSLRAELVTSAHREFAPPVLTDETITVSGIGPLPQLPGCPPAPSATP